MIDFTVYAPLGEDVGWPGDVSDDDAHAAGDAIRRACGWHIAPSKQVTIRVEADGGRTLTLPSLHVTAVTEVLGPDGTAITGWRLTTYSQLVLPDRMCWPRDQVTVTMTHGFPTTPGDVVAVLTELAQQMSPEDSSLTGMGPFQFSESGSRAWAGRIEALSRYQLWPNP